MFVAQTSQRLHCDQKMSVSDSITRQELNARFAGVSAEIKTSASELRAEMSTLRADLHQLISAQTKWIVGSSLAMAGIVIGVLKTSPPTQAGTGAPIVGQLPAAPAPGAANAK